VAADRLGVLAWTLGEIYYTVVLWTTESPPIPRPPTRLSCSSRLALLGVLALLRARARDVPRRCGRRLDRRAGGRALSAAIVFETVLDARSGKPLAVATALAYPLTDLVLLGVASARWRHRLALDRTWVLLAVGVSTFWLADSLYLVRPPRAPTPRRLVRHRLDARPAADRPRLLAAGGRAPAEHAGRAALHLRAARLRLGRPGTLIYGCLTDMNPVAVGLSALSLVRSWRG
jgi:hypothetical protein